MLNAIINIMLTILAIIGIIIICLLIVLIFVLVTYYQVKDAQRAYAPKTKLTFDGPSRAKMSATTARLMKEDKRRYRRPYMRTKLAMSSNR